MVGKLCANIWKGPHIYKVTYEVLYSIDEIPYPETDVCYGAKCHEYIPQSFDNWCMDCHGHPDDEMVSRMIHIMLGESNDYKPLEFGQIFEHVTKISVISTEDITQTNSLYIKRSNRIIQNMFKKIYISMIQTNTFAFTAMDHTSILTMQDKNIMNDTEPYTESRKIRRIE
jgi:hypothetical protein